MSAWRVYLEDVRAHASSSPVAEEGANACLGGVAEKCENLGAGVKVGDLNV
jgi:hypothetical protein